MNIPQAHKSLTFMHFKKNLDTTDSGGLMSVLMCYYMAGSKCKPTDFINSFEAVSFLYQGFTIAELCRVCDFWCANLEGFVPF